MVKYRMLTLILFLILAGCSDKEYKFSSINPKCGPQSLQFVMELYGIDSSLEELCALADYTEKSGSSMYGLYKAAEKKGLAPEASKTNLDKLCINKFIEFWDFYCSNGPNDIKVKCMVFMSSYIS